MRNSKKILLLCFLLCLAALVLPAQTREGRRPGDDLTIKVAVMGPGDQLYFWWGHISLIIEDARTGLSRVYDYGIFSFDSENFFVNFAFGRLIYCCGASPMQPVFNAYIRTNRDITVYTLDLPPEKREEVRAFAEENILPENRYYSYHHFDDNCSTRIRDIIDLATDGQFREQFGNAPGRYTLRQHVRRHTWFSPFADWALNFLMGQGIDTPITIWKEMFLPAEVGKRISGFQYTDSSGVSRHLVSGVETVYAALGRPGVLDVPRRQWPRELAFSLVIAALLGFLFFIQSKKPALGQVALGVSHSILGLFFGIAGLLLFFMSFFTNHDYTWHNANLLFANPLLLAAVPLGIRYAGAKTYDERFIAEALLRLLWFLVVLGIFLSMLIKLFPPFWQQNLTDQMLMLPIALVLALEPFGLKKILERVFRKRT
ncbi:MAG: DUF4105 domain-containing protein [Treponema sp.]|jgi:hypothetical protein|nr:DUF4105 domain-containing protein [Treponema sp.]